MVSCHEENVTGLLAALVDFSNRLVRLCTALDRGFVDSSMPDHIWRSEVIHHEFVFAILDSLAHALCDGHCGHGGLLVIGGHFRRGDELAVLIIKLHLSPSV